jgi:hypothetical protein
MSRRLAYFTLGAGALAAAVYLWLRPVMGAGLRWWTVYGFVLSANLI